MNEDASTATSAGARPSAPRLLLALVLLAPCAHARVWQVRIKGGDAPLSRAPVVITAKRMLGDRGGVSVDRIRVTDSAGGAVRFQVDHRDERGRFVPADATFSGRDELVFLVDVEAGGETSCRVVAAAPGQEGAPAGGGIEAKRVAEPRADLRLKNSSDLTVAIMGACRDRNDPPAARVENFGMGAITQLKFWGVSLLSVANWAGTFIPNHPFGGKPGGDRAKWRAPELVCNGPVRAIVRVEADDVKVTGKVGNVWLAGRVVRHFAVYDETPTVDVEDVIEYDTALSLVQLTYLFPVAAGGRGNSKDVLIVPEGDDARVASFAETEPREGADYFTAYNSRAVKKLPDGYFAWVDARLRHGLAVFYENANCRLHIVCSKRTILTEPQREFECGSDRLIYTFAGLDEKTPKRLVLRWRLWCQSGVNPAAVRAGYRHWASPAVEVRAAGAPAGNPPQPKR